ncbi:hypothetical protein Mgra_00007725 [Meloidogyne graminicola]|uniref:Uncharacterized protein n=1 Tax=Meloidogyne graminicola TaxID=189291 RepID=A0A8S9ZHV5_9BILA|nr:hypothetical protein Mgra_00007725 [Meloidogyne graminicola]
MFEAAASKLISQFYELFFTTNLKTKSRKRSIKITHNKSYQLILFEILLIIFAVIVVNESATFQRVQHYIERRSQKIEETNLNDENFSKQVENEENKNSSEISESCDIFANEQLHALMDRICELCHDMYSHRRPNMRADCRSGCFRSENFKRCLRLFRPIGLVGSKNRKRSIKQVVEAI